MERGKRKIKWLDDDIGMLRQLCFDGEPYAIIAEKMKRSRAAVQLAATRNGIFNNVALGGRSVPNLTQPKYRGSRSTDIGTAAEFLVCADLILAGHRAFPSNQAMPYDVVCDFAGRLLRIAVKGVTTKSGPYPHSKRVCYRSSLTRSGARKKNPFARYTTEECDLVALVAIPERKVIYLPPNDGGFWVTCFVVDPPGSPPPENYRNMGSRQMWEHFSLELALSKVKSS